MIMITVMVSEERWRGRRAMRGWLAATVIYMIIAMSWPATAGARRLIQEGAAAPPFRLNAVGGKEVSSESFSHQVMVLLFVRPGQARSVEAMKDVTVLRRTVAEPSWNLVAVVSGTFSSESVEALRSATGFGDPILLDPKMTVYGAYGAIVTPSVVLVGRDGKVVFSKAGHDFEFETALAASLQFALGLIDAKERDRLVTEGRGPERETNKVARLLGLARKLAEDGHLDEAEISIRRALEADPESLEARIHLGDVLLRKGDAAGAMKEFRAVADRGKRSGPLHLDMGRALVLLGKPEAAEAEFLEAIRLSPQAGLAHYELGKLYEAQGKKDEAIREYRRAVESLLKERAW